MFSVRSIGRGDRYRRIDGGTDESLVKGFVIVDDAGGVWLWYYATEEARAKEHARAMEHAYKLGLSRGAHSERQLIGPSAPAPTDADAAEEFRNRVALAMLTAHVNALPPFQVDQMIQDTGTAAAMGAQFGAWAKTFVAAMAKREGAT